MPIQLVRYHTFLILFLLLILSCPGRAQDKHLTKKDSLSDNTSVPFVRTDTLHTITDTVSIVKVDSISEISDSVHVKKHSPARAAYLSAVFPGLGQIYNKKGIFYKLPLLYAGLATELYFVITLNQQYQLWHTAYVKFNYYYTEYGNNITPYMFNSIMNPVGYNYDDALNNGTLNITAGLKSNNDYFHHWRDFNVLLLGAVYALNIIDASVEAYFFDYDISDNLSLQISPSTDGNKLALKDLIGIKLTFNLH